MFYSDYHIHTNFSSDSTASMNKMIQQAIKCGLKEIAITDHIDFQYPDSNFPFQIKYKEYSNTIKNFQELYKNKITIRIGVEIGLQPQVIEQNIELCKNNFYDFVIGSSHCVDGFELCSDTYFMGKTKKQAYTRYFEDVLDNVETCNFFNVYGHIDYINRYSDYEENTLHYKDYSDILDEIMEKLIEKGQGIEINTSGYKYGLGHTHPQLPMLKRYKELGGEIVTIGSDAHIPEFISDHFDKAYEMLKQAGFKAITTFKNRKPIFVDITDYYHSGPYAHIHSSI